jgi:hypothetical protein
MGLAKRLLDAESDEPLFDIKGDEWMPLTARNPLTCTDPNCGASISVGERFYRCDANGHIFHVECWEMMDGYRRAMARD